MKLTRLFSVLLLAILASTPAFPAKPFDESLADRERFHLFGGPSREGPEAQWTRCNELVNAGKERAAIRHCGYLAETWPEHPLAIEALRLKGDLYFARGKHKEAFDAYQVLMDRYAGKFDYDALLQQQFEVAVALEERYIRAIFGLSRYQNPEDAIPLYRQLLTNAPHWEKGPEILHRIGEILMRGKKFREAITEFDLFSQRYPNSPLREEAAIRRTEAFVEIARRYPTDARATENAWVAITYYLETHPGGSEAAPTLALQREFNDRMAKTRFDQAEFYLNAMRRPEAALAAYRALVEQFPDSEWTQRAKARIQELTAAPERR